MKVDGTNPKKWISIINHDKPIHYMGVAPSILSRWCIGFSSTKAGYSAQTWTIHAGDIDRSQRRGSGRNRWEGGLRVLLANLGVNVSYPRGTWPKGGTNHQFANLSQIIFEEHAHGDKMFESLNDVFRVATCKLSLFGAWASVIQVELFKLCSWSPPRTSL